MAEPGPAERARTAVMRGALGLAVAGGVAVTVAAVRHLASCPAAGAGPGCVRELVVWALPAPVAGAPALDLTVRVDGLSALFLALVGLCASCIAVYSFGWLRHDPLRHSVAVAFDLFVAAILLALVVDNLFWLLVALELITLVSANLVRYRGRSGGSPEASRTAVRTYLVVGQASLVCLLAGLLPVAVASGTLDFDGLRAGATSPAPAVSFALVLLGLGIRAGVSPFHFWVPVVHPQLPTNTHAMMSAVMLKVAVYLMIRCFLEGMLGPVQWWWGAVVLVLAGATALVTVFYALLCGDLKTALAYHSVENVGIILAGLGLALLFGADRFAGQPAMRAAAALALLASLYHVVNHALFKTLLFLGAGAVERQAGTVETRLLGGLLRASPWVGVPFLVGAVAIAGFPPLNGFVSEWLTLQALFGGQAVYRQGGTLALAAMVALVLGLVLVAASFALTALAFVKLAGETLLGPPRGPRAADGRVAWSMRSVLVLLAGACLLLGLQPWLLVPWLEAAVAATAMDAPMLQASSTGLTVELGPGYRAALPMWPLLAVGVVPLLLTLWVRAGAATRRPVWAGGEAFQPRTMQYTGGAFSSLVWELVAGPPGASPGAPLPASFRLSGRLAVVEQANRLVNGLVTRVTTASQRAGDRVQDGDIRNYLLYIFGVVMVVLVLLVAALLGPP